MLVALHYKEYRLRVRGVILAILIEHFQNEMRQPLHKSGVTYTLARC